MSARVIGKVCPRHPELEGARYASNRACVGCSAEWRTKQAERPKTRAQLLAERDELLAVLEGLFEIGNVFTSAIEAVDPFSGGFEAWEKRARAAIAKARGVA